MSKQKMHPAGLGRMELAGGGIDHFSKVPSSEMPIVDRSALSRRVGSSADLTVLHALPGYGKTTLMAAWARDRRAEGHCVEWVNVAATSDEGVYLAAAQLALGGQHCATLVLDDFQYLKDEVLIDDLCALIKSVPTFRIVVATTSWLPLRQAAQKRHLTVNEIDGAALLANASELAAMAATWGRILTNNLAKELHGITRGWLHLSRLILDGGWKGSALPEEAKKFLIEHVDPEDEDALGIRIAARVTLLPLIIEMPCQTMASDRPEESADSGPPKVALVPKAGQQQGMFERSPAFSESLSWRLPEIARAALAEDFVNYSSDVARGWHRRMARVLFECGDDVETGLALSHARRGEEWAVLGALWRGKGLLLAVQYPTEFRFAFGGLPRAATESDPMLTMASAAATASARFDGGPEGYLAGHRALMQGFRDVRDPRKRVAKRSLSPEERSGVAVARMVGERSMGCFTEAVRTAHNFAVQDSRAISLGLPVENSGQTPWFRQQHALSILLSGDLPRAMEHYASAYDRVEEPGDHFVTVDAASSMALVCTLMGLVESARIWLDRAAERPVGHDWLQYQVSIPAFIARALLAADALDEERVQAELSHSGDGTNQVEMWPFIVLASSENALIQREPALMSVQLERVAATNSATNSGGSLAEQLLARCRAELFMAQGELNQAARALEDSKVNSGWKMLPAARLSLLAGNYDRAARQAASGVWSKAVWQRDKVDLWLVQAVALEKAEQYEGAGNAFSNAVALAGVQGQIRPFRGFDPELLASIAKRVGVELPPEQQKMVAARSPLYPNSANLVVLSPREIAVLYQMARHETLSDIAKELVVSRNTIKKQVAAIYSKFGVHDREAALDWAHRLAFLPEPRVRD